ncbi:hypothetical protein ACFL7M_13665 [Thermodesulfobacteriota bacterium]
MDWLFEDQRVHPSLYDIFIQGNLERTVSIRGGISWPQSESPGYFVLLAQLEKRDSNGNLRFLAFYEDMATITSEFFKKIAWACSKWRIDELLHGGQRRTLGQPASGESAFSDQLSDYLEKKEKRYELVQLPSIGPSWRANDPDFLVSLVRDSVANQKLLLFQLSDNRTPRLFDRIRNTDLELDFMEIPELRALSYVLDDFEVSPWEPPPGEERSDY